MDNKQFKKIFGEIANENGFSTAFGGWFQESEECIVALNLQKSNYGNYYDLNIKFFIQGMFDNHYVKNKDLVKKFMGNTFTRQPKEFDKIFDLDQNNEDRTKRLELQKFFQIYLSPLISKALSKTGIKELAKQDKIYLTEAVEEQLSELLK